MFHSSQGLTYSLVAAEALLAPAIPSVAARAGGLFLPLAKALCLACGACCSQRCTANTGRGFCARPCD
jgi:di/tricarboxylate transporter